MDNCVFCKLLKEHPERVLLSNENCFVINPLESATKVHFLIIPKVHYKNILEVPDDILISMMEMARKLQEKNTEKGVRLVANINEAASIHHMHWHFLSPVDNQRHV